MNKISKKTRIIFVGVMATGLFMVACQKGNNPPTPDYSSNRLIMEYKNEEKTSSYLMLTQIGHDGKNCSGCVLFEGKRIHKDCQGHGNYCRKAVSVVIDTVGALVTATTTDTFGLTSEDFFLMPARSLNYTDTNNNRVFLNIPAQLIYRDTTTLQFTFTGLSFTSSPLY